MNEPATHGVIHGVGIGPGAVDLMTVRADRLIRNARHLAHFRKAGRQGQARQIIGSILRPDVNELAMEYPVTTEIPVTDPRYNAILSNFYAESVARLTAIADAGEDVVVVSEGDPFFYGSFMHIYARLTPRQRGDVVPAVTGMSAAWTATGLPITWGDDVLSVMPAALPEDELVARMSAADAIVVMKVGRNLNRVRRALQRAERADDAWLVEYASMEGERVRRLADAPDENAPYFSIVLAHGEGRRP